MSYQVDELKKDIIHAQTQLNRCKWRMEKIKEILENYFIHTNDIQDIPKAINIIDEILEDLDIPE